MKTNMLPLLVCLGAGALLGFFLGQGSNATPEAASTASHTGTAQAVKPVPVSGAASGVASSGAKAVQPPSMAPALTELIDDYSPKRARRLTDAMTLEQIKAAFADLTGKAKDDSAISMSMDLLRAWARLDSKGAWQAILNMPATAERSRLLGVVAGELAKTNGEAAVQLAMTLPPGDRSTVTNTLFFDWIKANPVAAVTFWNAHPEMPSDAFMTGSALTTLAATDPATAARLALTLRGADTDLSSGPTRSVLEKWIETDAAGARRWLDSITDPVLHDRALRAFATARTLNDPQMALEITAQISSTDERQKASRDVINNWIKSNPEGAIAYLAGRPATSNDREVSVWAGSSLSALTQAEQERLLMKLPDGEMKRGIVRELIRKDTSAGRYADGVNMLNQMPESSERDSSLHHLAYGWAKADPKAMQAWMDKQPDSSDRDLLVSGYCTNLASTDPQAAINLANSIPDTSVQKTALQNIMVRWLQSNPTEANAWMTASSLFTDNDRRFIQTMAKSSYFSPSTPRIKLRR